MIPNKKVIDFGNDFTLSRVDDLLVIRGPTLSFIVNLKTRTCSEPIERKLDQQCSSITLTSKDGQLWSEPCQNRSETVCCGPAMSTLCPECAAEKGFVPAGHEFWQSMGRAFQESGLTITE